MAFNNIGPVSTIAPGAFSYWTYSRGNHEDLGTQLATADVKSPGGPIIALDEGKKMEDNGQITYSVTFHNVGNVPVKYNLQGGGMV